MAIRNIKQIVNNRGYLITEADRKIFEKGDLQSFFGFSETDAIEFIIYDINNNQLPQKDGKLVRYVKLTTQNINDYFLIPEGTVFQRFQLPKEYFIDVERLMAEAGYTNGIFKTQTTLLNKRVGSEKEFDKLWIKDISPSRTEARVLPLQRGLETNPELKIRYDAFVNDLDFREDTIAYLFQFLEKVKANVISPFLRTKYTEAWLTNVINEFKIANFEVFLNTIYEKFVQSCFYEFTNKISTITDVNYGKPKSTRPPITLSRRLIIELCNKILVETINYYLPAQNNRNQAVTVADFIPSLDDVGRTLQSAKSDTVFNPTTVNVQFVQVTYPNVTETKATLDAAVKDASPNPTSPVVTPDGTPPYTPPNNTPTTDDIVDDLTDGDGPRSGFGDPKIIVPGRPQNVPVP